MASFPHSSHMIKEWSTATKKVVEGQPPGPDAHPNTIMAARQSQDVKMASPYYKSGISTKTNCDGLPVSSNVRTSTSSTLNGVSDYKVRESQDHYKLHVLDPKVSSHANGPLSRQFSSSANSRKRPEASRDFPSQHMKCSLLKLEPMEQRKQRSVESRPITTSAYLNESVERHREMEQSRLKEHLRARENEANRAWDKPDWPGCKSTEMDDSKSELQNIRQRIEALQKKHHLVNWPPINAKRPQTLNEIRNITDPDRIEKYLEQKRREEEALLRREEQLCSLKPLHLKAQQMREDSILMPENKEKKKNGGFKTDAIPKIESVKIAKNEIITGKEQLKRDAYEVDLLAKREVFIKSPQKLDPIEKTDKIWRPPEQKPSILALSIAYVNNKLINEEGPHPWSPFMPEPEYKIGTKAFLPDISTQYYFPTGTESLDKAARKQLRDVKISIRNTPAYSDSPLNFPNRCGFDINPRDAKKYHLVNGNRQKLRPKSVDIIPDWEKIYDLPAHSSTLTEKNQCLSVDLKERRAIFEKKSEIVPKSHTPNLTAADGTQQNGELEELRNLREHICEQSKSCRSDYKMTESDIQKQGPGPVPGHIKDQIREQLESRVSNDTSSTSFVVSNDRSGYITDVSSPTWRFSSPSFSPKSVVAINGDPGFGLLRVRTDLSPSSASSLRRVRELSRSNAAVQTAHVDYQTPFVLLPIENPAISTMTREFDESYTKKISRYGSLPTLDDDDDKHSTLIRIKDDRSLDKPRSIMKRREFESKRRSNTSDSVNNNNIINNNNKPVVADRSFRNHDINVVRSGPAMTETVEKTEEIKKTEEVERRIHNKERRDRKHHRHNGEQQHGCGRQRIGGVGGHREASDYENNTSLHPIRTTNDHWKGSNKRQLTRKFTDNYQQQNELDSHYKSADGNRHGSLSDSLRRGDLRYVPNGDLKERHHSKNGRTFRTFSNRDVFRSDFNDRHHSLRRGQSPIIELPPTLNRDVAPRLPPHRNGLKSGRSRYYADWDEPKDWSKTVIRYDDDMSRLEREFHESQLLPMPMGNMNVKDYQTEQIPGGYESLKSEVMSNTGRKLNRDGKPVNFNESKQEYNYKHETETDGWR